MPRFFPQGLQPCECAGRDKGIGKWNGLTNVCSEHFTETSEPELRLLEIKLAQGTVFRIHDPLENPEKAGSQVILFLHAEGRTGSSAEKKKRGHG